MPAVREIITIDEEKCTGCGECVPGCPEGAIRIIDGKARLVSDLFCDGLGACLGECPEGAITIETREAEPYDERRVMANVITQGEATVRAHLAHLRDHGQTAYLDEAIAYLEEQGIEVPEPDAAASQPSGCPGTAARQFEAPEEEQAVGRAVSQLRQWPVQIALVSPLSPCLQDAEIVLVADCVPFAYANLHEDFLKGKTVLVGCPKLDDVAAYRKKLAAVFEHNDLKSIEVLHMEVPCCYGLVRLVEQALADAGKAVPTTLVEIGIKGNVLGHRELSR